MVGKAKALVYVVVTAIFGAEYYAFPFNFE